MGKGDIKYMRTWKPDTCECVVEELYEGSQIVGGGEVLKKCDNHAEVADEDLYGVLYANPDGENKVKNQMHRVLLGMEDVKGLGLEESVTREDGTQEIKLKKDVEYKWSFEGIGYNRKLKVEVPGGNLTKTKKDLIRAHVNTKFGNNKVEIL